MKSFRDLKNRTPHDDILEGNNSSYIALGYFPSDDLEKILPRGMSVPSGSLMARAYPTVKKLEGRHPFTLLFSNCRNVHDVLTEIQLRPYRELMFFLPVSYRHGNEEQLCSYVPVLYLDYLIGVIGGMYLGLRKEFHPGMKDMETETTKSFSIEGILDVSFKKDPTGAGRELDPFFVQTFVIPTVTLSYFNRINFYTTKVFPRKVLDASHEYEWRYKGSVIESSKDTFAHYAEYRFTTSQAMRYRAYFHPSYPVK